MIRCLIWMTFSTLLTCIQEQWRRRGTNLLCPRQYAVVPDPRHLLGFLAGEVFQHYAELKKRYILFLSCSRLSTIHASNKEIEAKLIQIKSIRNLTSPAAVYGQNFRFSNKCFHFTQITNKIFSIPGFALVPVQ